MSSDWIRMPAAAASLAASGTDIRLGPLGRRGRWRDSARHQASTTATSLLQKTAVVGHV
jgi:hypothetical protein